MTFSTAYPEKEKLDYNGTAAHSNFYFSKKGSGLPGEKHMDFRKEFCHWACKIMKHWLWSFSQLDKTQFMKALDKIRKQCHPYKTDMEKTMPSNPSVSITF